MIRVLCADDSQIFRHLNSAKSGNHNMIQSIIDAVRERGDDALTEFDTKFGGAASSLRLEQNDIRQAYNEVSPGLLEAIRSMSHNLERAERALLETVNSIPDMNGITRTFTPIPSVGCYVPGGKARYPSSAVMSVIPASVAGVDRIVVVSPPVRGGMDAATVVAADHCGAHEIYCTGGAQAVAALAYGTESIRNVDRIVGPGSAVVTAAKRIVSADVSIDMTAGPTELGILADKDADAGLIALDLISQAEHSPDTVCFLITDSNALARNVSATIEARMGGIERPDIVRTSLYENGFIVLCDSKNQALDVAQRLAPEHLQVMTRDPRTDAAMIRTAGLVLVGHNTPSAASDYMLGSNHILPTEGRGRLRGQLSVLDFVRMNTRVEVNNQQMQDILPHMMYMTDAEGLPNHFEAVRGRVR